MRAWGWEWGPRDRGWYGDGEVLRQAWLGWIQNMGDGSGWGCKVIPMQLFSTTVSRPI